MADLFDAPQGIFDETGRRLTAEELKDRFDKLDKLRTSFESRQSRLSTLEELDIKEE